MRSVTERLYHRDPAQLTFDAEVLAHGELEGRPTVVLARTAFYPEAGGQMADRGVLAGLSVLDVQADAEGRVHHALDGLLPKVGEVVAGSVDGARRRAFMALHTGQHIFSRALVDAAKAETVSSRLGETSCTVDVDRTALSDAALARALELTHAVIDDDLPVRAWFPDAAELASLPLRRKAKVDADVRVVAVGDFDFSPCGGTHCTRSGQVGLVEVFGVERYKGMLRITFDAGPRARATVVGESRTLRALGATLSCGPADVPTAVERVRSEVKDARTAMKALGDRAAEGIARELGAGTVAARLDAGDRELLRAVATRLCAVPDAVVALAVAEVDGLAVLVARGGAATTDCGAVLRRLAMRTGGKGGGRADRAEGKVPLDVDFVAIASEELGR